MLGVELALPQDGAAAVLICKKGKKLTLRETCKSKETQVAATELGVTGPPGADGTDGTDGAPGTFATALTSGQTIRGNYNIGGEGAAADALANTSISFITTFAVAPTTHLILEGGVAPAECTGTATMPEAAPGHLCVYEQDTLNTAGVLENQTTRSGATIFIMSNAAGNFFSFGAWAVTAP
jgi:hypothetical protein